MGGRILSQQNTKAISGYEKYLFFAGNCVKI